MGLGKSLRKAWKKTFGKVEDVAKPYAPIIAGVALGALTGGLGFAAVGSSALTGALVGGGVGALNGFGQYQSLRDQEKMTKAQIASSEKIAQMQQQVVVSADPAPVQKAQTAQLSEANDATRKARAFRFSNSVRRATLGGGLGGSKTLG